MADKIVEVPGLGNVAFPDTMSDDDIAAQIRKNSPQQPAAAAAPAAPAQPSAISRFAHGVYDSTVGPAVQAISHPIDTLTGLGKQAIGKEDLDAVHDAVKAGDYKGAALHLGKWAMSKTPEGMALKAGYDLVAPTVEAAQKGDYAGAGGRAVGTAASFLVPELAGKGFGAVDAAADATAQGLAKSALKGGYEVTRPAAEVADAARTLREGQYGVTPTGAQKIGQALEDLRKQIEPKITDATNRGVTVDPKKAMLRLDETRAKYQQQVNPPQDIRDIDQVGENFMAQHTSTIPAKPASTLQASNGQPLRPATPASTVTVPIPADQAQAIKVGSNTLNSDKYGKVSTAQVEAEKALTRGIKEELEAQIPELGKLNAAQAKLLNLDDILGKAVNKYANSPDIFHDKVGLGMAATGAAGAIATHSPELAAAGAAASVLRAVLSNPAFKARLATAIDSARRTGATAGKIGTTATRGGAVVNNLIANLTPAQQPDDKQPQQ